LVLGDRVVDRIGVREVGSFFDGERSRGGSGGKGFADEGLFGELGLEVLHNLVGCLRIDLFVVVTERSKGAVE